MWNFIRKRLVQFVFILLIVSMVCFSVNFYTPIDTAKRALSDPMSHTLPDEEVLERFREEHGLNRPLHIQYGEWLGNVLHGDLGNSLISGEPVLEQIVHRFGNTFKLAIFAMTITILFGISLGILCALKQDRIWDILGRLLGMLAVSIPGFWLAYLLIILFALKLGWLPVGGYGDGGLVYMILPGIAMSLMSFGVMMKMTRNNMIEVMKQDYMITAEAKGLNKFQIIGKHALKNAMIPVITLCGMTFASMLAGTAVIEKIFAWPGIGNLILDAINNKDFPMVQGCVIFISMIYLLINLAVDIFYILLNPRIRYEKED